MTKRFAHGLDLRSPAGKSGLLVAVVALAGCGAPSPVSQGETVVILDTDLPVPDVVTNARIDVYGEDGLWLASREVVADDRAAWPLSFGLAAGDRPERRLVRLRVFPRHRMRGYRGAHGASSVGATALPEPVATPSTLEGLCAAPPELPLGGEVTLRFGIAPVTAAPDASRCAVANGDLVKPVLLGGAAAARFTASAPGTYRFEAERVVPPEREFLLLLRRDCAEPDSQVTCAGVARGSGMDVALEAGSYTLIATANGADQAGEIVLRATREGAAPPAASAEPAHDGGTPALSPAWPRLVDGARDATPPEEPREEVSSETFALVDVVPGRTLTATIVASTACVGKPAAVLAKDEQRLDLGSLLSCVDGAMQPPPSARPSTPGGPTRAGAGSAPSPCEPTAPERACVEGGMYVMGSELFGGTGVAASAPLRIARIATFYVDRDEYGVAEYRAARAEGYTPRFAPYLGTTEGPLDPASGRPLNVCTYSATPLGREDYPLNCVTWPVARALCQRRGGDLPTEAMWEYMARKAGRSRVTLYPWGDDPPDCARTVFERSPEGACAKKPTDAGPQPRAANAGDVNPLGIRGLGGNVGEWCRDTFASYEDPCWTLAPLDDPWCDREFAPMRAARGGHWAEPESLIPAAIRDATGAMTRAPTMGFRCVYTTP